ncbi:MAG: PIN domain-containing protein [Nanoarchaeota archaeon]
MTDSKLIDSSVWLSYFFNGDYREIIESDDVLYLSALSVFEIRKKLWKEKIESAKIMKCMGYLTKRSLILDVTTEIADTAVAISIENQLAAVDALIYTTALLHDAVLITKDNDFRGLKRVNIFKLLEQSNLKNLTVRNP